MKKYIHFNNGRRKFLKDISLTLGSTAIAVPLLSFNSGKSITKAKENSMRSDNQNVKIGIALVGLGQYSTNQLAPALQQTEHCYLAGIVTGTPSKITTWQSKYNIPDKNVYNYDTFDKIAENPDIDIVYVVLPNALHAEYTIRAANAGKDVICEKPMATSVEDAEQMIKACNKNRVQLAIGYRLHYEPFNKRSMELGQQEIFGEVQNMEAAHSGDMTNGDPDVWRLDKNLAGGGPLMDLGIYCVQAAIYSLGKMPVAVTAEFGEVTKPTYFYDVEQSINWQMEFDNGAVADCRSSYAENEDLLKVTAKNGWWKLAPAYAYDGKKGETSEGKMNLPNVYEQVRQMDSQAENFRSNKQSIAPGEMGLRDMRILMAIYESANAGNKRVQLL